MYFCRFIVIGVQLLAVTPCVSMHFCVFKLYQDFFWFTYMHNKEVNYEYFTLHEHAYHLFVCQVRARPACTCCSRRMLLFAIHACQWGLGVGLCCVHQRHTCTYICPAGCRWRLGWLAAAANMRISLCQQGRSPCKCAGRHV